ncbi:hypothetical protein H072_6875 [Dactylellina haptotyla CBS 200.50]|uniref:G domain-containing protein n=1 Tax=Dactylellina haptotyla (strain CBS 200.50) TaxID=1284197 RepID=S8A8Q2_DACHA|nr:hypothetical protein H072_6875 [Dactylellina haptotyla CBS 200.50]
MAAITSKEDDLNSNPRALEKHIEHLITDGRAFLKTTGQQLQHMHDGGLLSKGGIRVHKHIQKYENTDLGAKSIIAFIGESGAGKSTLLNALLDYEKIVPTSGMRACTSVATEFSSRKSNMEFEFCAVIEYIDRKEFEEEAESLRYDILDDEEEDYDTESMYTILSSSDEEKEQKPLNARSSKRRRLSNSSAEGAATVARAKLGALFPGFQASDFVEITEKINELYDGNCFLSAGRQIIESDDEEEFVEQIQELISNSGTDDEDEPQLWPLIKVVKVYNVRRIYLDSEILGSGAVLVDLPGIKDCNAAREAVAGKYLAKANEVIIVSRLNRVLTDETTTKLAEMGYSKQLRLDGRKKITIVCSFADQYKPSDARQEYRKNKEFVGKYDELMRIIKSAPRGRQLKKLSAIEKERVLDETEDAKERLQKLCLATRNKHVPGAVRKAYTKHLGEDIQVKTFLVASTAYQVQAGRLVTEERANNSVTADETQIPQLREFCIKIPTVQKLFRMKFFIHNISRAFGAAKFLVEDLGPSLSKKKREGISDELNKAAVAMKRALLTLETNCSDSIKLEIEKLTGETKTLSLDSSRHCAEVQKTVRSGKQQWNYNTYKHICRRNGEHKTDSKKNLNQKYLGALDDGLSRIWGESVGGIHKSLTGFTFKLSSQLTAFEERWMSIVCEYFCHESADMKTSEELVRNTLKAVVIGTQKLLLDQTHRVDEKQREINRQFRSTNQLKSGLEQSYQAAAKLTGKGSYNSMMDVVTNGLKSTTVFLNISELIAKGLADLQVTLKDENTKWCNDIGEELETNIKNWMAVSDKVEEQEYVEKQKLKEILSRFDKTLKNLVDEADSLDGKLTI